MGLISSRNEQDYRDLGGTMWRSDQTKIMSEPLYNTKRKIFKRQVNNKDILKYLQTVLEKRKQESAENDGISRYVLLHYLKIWNTFIRLRRQKSNKTRKRLQEPRKSRAEDEEARDGRQVFEDTCEIRGYETRTRQDCETVIETECEIIQVLLLKFQLYIFSPGTKVQNRNWTEM